MSDLLIKCAREGCKETFVKKKHNQIYHDDDCCKLATSKRLKDRYYEKRKRKLGIPRTCSVCEKTKLNSYNDNNMCSSCEDKQKQELNDSVKNMILSITWEL